MLTKLEEDYKYWCESAVIDTIIPPNNMLRVVLVVTNTDN